MDRLKRHLDQVLIVLTWGSVIAVALSLFVGKVFNLYYERYVSDIFVNTDTARNFWDYGLILRSSVFNNMAAVHL